MGLKNFIHRMTAPNHGNGSLFRSHPPGDDYWYTKAVRVKSHAGVPVDEETALRVTTVWRCVNILSETVGSLPRNVYRREGKKRYKDTEHHLQYLVHTQPNSEMTSVKFHETAMAHLALWGNCYAEIVRDLSGKVVALWLLRPDRMCTNRIAGGSIEYKYLLSSGEHLYFKREQLLHITGLSFNGITGYSPIEMEMEAVGISLATERFASSFFGRGARPGGVIKMKGTITPEQKRNLKKSFQDAYGGVDNAHRVLLLEEDYTWEQMSIPNDQAQFIETRKFQVQEICRIFGVPPHLVHDLSGASNKANIEEENIGFYTRTIRPWLVRIEQEYSKLFPEKERKDYFIKHVIDGLLRGDVERRYKAYAIGKANGFLSSNDIREMEDMNPIDDPGGDIYLMPMNMVPLVSGSTVTQPPSELEPPEQMRFQLLEDMRYRSEQAKINSRKSIGKMYRKLFLEKGRRIVTRENIAIERELKKILGERSAKEDFLKWLHNFYNELPDYIVREIKALYQTYAEAINEAASYEIGYEEIVGPREALMDYIETCINAYSLKHCYRSLAQIEELLKEEEPYEQILTRTNEWRDTRPDKIATEQTVLLASAVAVWTFGEGGITLLKWVASSNSCPWCSSLNGKVIGIRSNFVDAGMFKPTGVDSEMKIRSPKKHSPLHDGCVCSVVAVRE